MDGEGVGVGVGVGVGDGLEVGEGSGSTSPENTPCPIWPTAANTVNPTKINRAAAGENRFFGFFKVDPFLNLIILTTVNVKCGDCIEPA